MSDEDSAIQNYLRSSTARKQTFGIYRFLPFFFILGASLEFSMINWKVGETSFYSVYKKNQAKKIAIKSILEEQSGTVTK
ncbi:hypothetical protein ScPMuIL_007861 [Solemya velum]